MLAVWKKGKGINLASKTFDSWRGNEPIPTEITSLLLIFPGYQSIYKPLLTSREVLMNQVFKNNIHQEVVNYSPSILWMNSHPTFPTPTWCPSAATWVFIQGLNLLSTNMCLGFHQTLTHQHPAQLPVLTQQKKGQRKQWSWGGVTALRRWRGPRPALAILNECQSNSMLWAVLNQCTSHISDSPWRWIRYFLVWLTKAAPLACC